MNTVEFLAHLRSLDIKVWADDDRLRYSAPMDTMTDELRSELSRHKPEILAFLRQARTATDVKLSPIVPVSRDQDLPLSSRQQRLWFLQQLRPESAAYNFPTATRITGPLNLTALNWSLGEIVRRHESLRTTFNISGQQPVQIIQAEGDYQLPVVDGHPAEVEQWINAEAWQPFDLASGPLFRAKLFRLHDAKNILCLNFHHIIFDGWSRHIFYQELAALYDAAKNVMVSPDGREIRRERPAGLSSLLSELSIQYVDFAQWEARRFQEVREQRLAYWRKQLAGELPTLQLPTDYPRPAIQSYQGATQTFVLPQALTERLKRFSQQRNVTLFITLLAAFKALLHRYSNQTDILVGTPSANRHHHDVTNLIGFFVNTLMLRTDLSGNPTFEALLTRIRDVTLEAQAHQDTPFTELVEALQPERDLSQQPFFQVMFVFQNTPPGKLTLPGLTTAPVPIENKIAKFDLTLEMVETEQGLIGAIEYSTDLFAAATISRVAGHLRTLLEGAVANPTQRLSDLPLLTESERHQLLVEWNDTEADYLYETCLHYLFEAQVERTPDAVAVIMPASGSTAKVDQQLTYRELNEQANQLAHYLQKSGVGPETLVGICVERSLEMVIGLLGILKAGGAYVPLDPTYPRERLDFMIEDIQTPILLTQAKLLGLLPDRGARVIYLDTDWPEIAVEPATNPDRVATADNLAYVIYTSGSTGKPKGAMNSHRAVSNRILWMQDAYRLDESDRVLQKTPFSFDVSGWEFHWPLQTGARLVMAQPEGHKDSAYLIEVINRQQITTIHFVPSMLHIFLDDPNVASCHSLRRVICSGEALAMELQERFFARLEAELHNLYGPTEAAIDVTYWACERNSERHLVPIGRPISNIQIYLLDPHLNPVPIGVPGELHIGGVGLGRGYLNRPELTAEKFIPNPLSHEPGARLYKTGDLARYLVDGNIEYLGRLDHQVKIRGFRIELGEIEAVLGQHPGVREVVVMAREVTPSDSQLVAYFLFKEEFPNYTGDLRHYLAEKLPDYMIPTAFIPLDEFPLTSNGKVNRRALPAPEVTRPDLAKNYVAPRNPVEKLLANIWAENIGLERVGLHDDFFELGGHSLQIARIAFQLRQIFQLDLPLSDFFKAPTVAGLAQAIQARQEQTLDSRTIDLEAEAALDPIIQPKAPIVRTTQPASVFLTGSTGYVGGFLLREILHQTKANVYCLVRATTAEQALSKIRKNLDKCYLWDDNFRDWIVPIVGDLSRPYFGLAEREFAGLARQIETVYHCGALVNLIFPYHTLKLPNVLGTQEVLRLATQTRTIPVHYISTFGIFNSMRNFDGRTIFEDDELPSSEGLVNGYSQSKWVAEKLMTTARTRGLPVAIYRSRLLVGDSHTGFWKTEDYFIRYIQGWIQLGSMPDLDTVWHMLPVDYGVRAIVHLAQQPESLGKVFHVTTPHPVSMRELGDFIRGLGYPLRQVPYQEWQAELLDLTRRDPQHALYPLLPHFVQPVSSEETITVGNMYTLDKEPKYDRRNLERGLAGTGIDFPKIDREQLTTYFSYFINQGFLPAPPGNSDQ